MKTYIFLAFAAAGQAQLLTPLTPITPRSSEECRQFNVAYSRVVDERFASFWRCIASANGTDPKRLIGAICEKHLGSSAACLVPMSCVFAGQEYYRAVDGREWETTKCTERLERWRVIEDLAARSTSTSDEKKSREREDYSALMGILGKGADAALKRYDGANRIATASLNRIVEQNDATLKEGEEALSKIAKFGIDDPNHPAIGTWDFSPQDPWSEQFKVGGEVAISDQERVNLSMVSGETPALIEYMRNRAIRWCEEDGEIVWTSPFGAHYWLRRGTVKGSQLEGKWTSEAHEAQSPIAAEVPNWALINIKCLGMSFRVENLAQRKFIGTKRR